MIKYIFSKTKHADFRPGIQEIAPNKVCVWMTMTTLEAAKSAVGALLCLGGFFLWVLPEVRIIDLKGTNWRLRLVVSQHWWLLQMKIWWPYLKSVFGYRLFSTFKCSSVTTSIQLQLVNETFPWGVCVVDSKSLSQVLFGTRALGTNQSWVWGSDIASQGTTKTERWIQYCKSTAFPSPVLIAKCSSGVPPGRFAKINSHWNWTREQLAVGDPWGWKASRLASRAAPRWVPQVGIAGKNFDGSDWLKAGHPFGHPAHPLVPGQRKLDVANLPISELLECHVIVSTHSFFLAVSLLFAVR